MAGIITPSLFRYMSFAGAEATIQNCCNRFSAATEFNDPFDMTLEESLGCEINEFLKDLTKEQWKLLVDRDLDFTKMRLDQNTALIAWMNFNLRKQPPEKLEGLRREIEKELAGVWNPETLQKGASEAAKTIQNDFQDWAILCMTKRKDNLLMWAHYADHHKGAVLEFIPAAEMDKDSALLTAKPVKYTKQRPLIYRTAADYVKYQHKMELIDATNEIIENLVLSKSPEWEHEQEYRVAVPKSLKPGEKHCFYKFHRPELAGVYLGCRMTGAEQVHLIGLAKVVNPEVKIYRVKRDKREYRLDFSEVSVTMRNRCIEIG